MRIRRAGTWIALHILEGNRFRRCSPEGSLPTKTAEGGASGGSQMDKRAPSFLPMRGRLAPIVLADVPYALASPEFGPVCHWPGGLGPLLAVSRECFARLPTSEASLALPLLASSTAPSRFG